MASTFNLSSAAANQMAYAMNEFLSAAVIDVYDGPQPEGADDPISPMNHPLATFQLPPSSMNQVADGVITLGVSPDSAWRANGKATFARVSKGGVGVFDCSVGVSNADMIINANPVVAGAVAHLVSGSSYRVNR